MLKPQSAFLKLDNYEIGVDNNTNIPVSIEY